MALGVSTALGSIGQIWKLARRVDDLFTLQRKMGDALERIEERLRLLENRMTRLEAEERQLVVEARSAASAAATTIAGSIISDTVTRLTRLEMQAERLFPSNER